MHMHVCMLNANPNQPLHLWHVRFYIDTQDERLQQTMESVGLEDRDLAKLWKVFRRCDKERNGTMTRNYFFVWLSERRTAFGDNLFEVLDLDPDSEILDFSEFVQVVATYCMFGTYICCMYVCMSCALFVK
jgi:hypothetical protein